MQIGSRGGPFIPAVSFVAHSPRLFRMATARIKKAFVLVMFITFGIGCSGGGGGSGTTSPTTYGFTGTVTSLASGVGVQGVTITLSGTSITTSTDSGGHYAFTGLSAGTYTPAAALANTIFSPASNMVTLGGSNPGSVDFVAIQGGTVASGLNIIPAAYSSNDQLRASVVVSGNSLFLTDSSDFPLKRLDLSGMINLAPRFRNAEGAVLRGQYAYWIDSGNLHKTSLDGTSSTILAQGPRDLTSGVTADIVVDNNSVYWVTTTSSSGCSPSCTWNIQQVPITGGTSVTLATVNRPVVALTADANNLYWEESFLEPVTPGCGCGSSIKSVPKAGGTTVVLVDGLLNQPSLPASWLPTGHIAVNGSQIFFGITANNQYTLNSIPVGGGAISTLATVTSSASFASNAILHINADATNIYWIDTANHTLDAMPLIGGSITTLASGLANPKDLVITTTSALWTDQGALIGCCSQMGGGSIKSVPLSGGAANTVIGNLDGPQNLATDGINLVWTETWRVAESSLSTIQPLTIAAGISSDMPRIAADNNNIYILDGDLIKVVPKAGGTIGKVAAAHGGSISDLSAINHDIATDGVNVYWSVKSAASGSPDVFKVAVAGGAVIKLASGDPMATPADCYWRIAVNATNVYWSSSSTQYPVGCAIKAVPISGGTVSTLVDYPYLRDFTLDADHVYFSELGSNPGSIQAIPIGGGTPAAVATNVVPWVLTNNATHLYWLDPSSNATIGRISKAAGTPTNASLLLPLTVTMEPLVAADALVANQDGIIFTEAPLGNIDIIW